jgi:DNA-directed RNA polymerase specialized sigma subunit
MARKVTKWNDLAHKASPEKRAQIAREVADEILERNLSELRVISGKTQAEVAAALQVTQGQVSQTESREDHKLSTLRRYVEALGGELEVVAAFGDRRVRLLGV